MAQENRNIDVVRTTAAVIDEFGSVAEFCRQVDVPRRRFYLVMEGQGQAWAISETAKLRDKLEEMSFLRIAEGDSDD